MDCFIVYGSRITWITGINIVPVWGPSKFIGILDDSAMDSRQEHAGMTWGRGQKTVGHKSGAASR